MAKITIEESASDPDTPSAGEAAIFIRSADQSVRVRDSTGEVRRLDTAVASGDVESLSTAGALNTVPTSDGAAGLAMGTPWATPITDAVSTHAGLANAHHSEIHTVASHSDTAATGAQLDTLVGGTATTLHTHAIENIGTASNDTAARVRPDGAGGLEIAGAQLEAITFTIRGPVAVSDPPQVRRWGFAGIIREVHVTALEAISTGDFTFRVQSGADHTAFAGGDLVSTLTLDGTTQDTEISATGLSHAFSAGHKVAPDVTVATGTQPSADDRAGVMVTVMYERT